MNRVWLVPMFFLSINALAEVAVVVHPSNTAALNAEEISKIYLGRSKSFPDGKAAIPLAQADGTGATATFNEKFLNKTGSQIKAYW